MPIRNKSGQLVDVENLSPVKPPAPPDFSIPAGRGLSAMCRITNRAKYCREDYNAPSKYFAFAFSGEIYPDGFDPENPDETGLLPGEHMDIPTAVAIHICGDVFDPNLEASEKLLVIRKHGDWEHDDSAAVAGNASGRNPGIRVIGLPPMPDLIVQQVSQRGKTQGEPVSILDFYLGKERLYIAHKAEVDKGKGTKKVLVSA